MKPYDSRLCNIEVSSFNKDSFFKQLEYYKNRYPRFNIIINLDNYNNFDELKNIIESIVQSGISESLCNFMINVKKRVFTKQEYDTIVKFCDYIDNRGSVLFFKELNVLWYDNEFKNAYNQIFATVDNLEDKILSPMEQLLYLYKQSANHIYNKERPTDAKVFSRSIIGIHNTGTIVCSGYADLLTAYCSILNNQNIKCFSIPVNVYKKNTGEYQNGHCFNIVYIKDDKYNLNGYYIMDSCWDSIKNAYDNMKLSYFLLPLKDINSYTDFNFKCLTGNNFFYLFNNSKILLDSDIKAINEILENQSIFDVKKEREIFKNKAVKQYLKYSQNPSRKKITEIKNSINAKKGQYEYVFLKSLIKKIFENPCNLEYSSIQTALHNVCVYGEKMDTVAANKYIGNVLYDTKITSIRDFDSTAINCFTVEERESRRLAHEFVERQKARRQARLCRESQKIKSQNCNEIEK